MDGWGLKGFRAAGWKGLNLMTGMFINIRTDTLAKMTETICVNKAAILDLIQVKDKFDAIVESLELMADKEFMESYNKSKEQVKKKDFVDWNGL